ncbi:MAG: hypothetical protein WCD45_09490, partial [Gallionella sp.]
MALPDTALTTATNNVRNILTFAIEHQPQHAALVVFDGQCELAKILTEAYQLCLPDAEFIDFEGTSPEVIRDEFSRFEAGDLVVLIQSTSFRLDAFRIRVELFKLGLKVIEHPHLSRMIGDAEALLYLDSLAYDPQYFRGTGNALKVYLDNAKTGMINSGGEELWFDAGFESAKLNVGDYHEMNNVGGQFPIGEVFTESKDLEAVHGRVRISIFGDTAFLVNKP